MTQELFDGKVALVTGAGGGIGLATAQAFAHAGAAVVLADRNAEALGAAAAELRTAGHTASGVPCDERSSMTCIPPSPIGTRPRVGSASSRTATPRPGSGTVCSRLRPS